MLLSSRVFDNSSCSVWFICTDNGFSVHSACSWPVLISCLYSHFPLTAGPSSFILCCELVTMAIICLQCVLGHRSPFLGAKSGLTFQELQCVWKHSMQRNQSRWWIAAFHSSFTHQTSEISNPGGSPWPMIKCNKSLALHIWKHSMCHFGF